MADPNDTLRDLRIYLSSNGNTQGFASYVVTYRVEDQAGQVDQDRRPQSRADIGRAGGEVAQLRMKCDVEKVFQLRVGCIHSAMHFLEVQSAAHGLHAQVVFFVNHDAE